MYAKRPAERAMLINATSDRTVLTAIKNFLTELRAGGERQLLQEIVYFNRHFHGPEFMIGEYIHRVNEAEKWPGLSESDEYTLAMPPNGVARFLETWGFRPKVRRMKGSFLPNLGADAIVGVKEGKASDEYKLPYDGLVRWMYRHGGKYYSGGTKFNTVKHAHPNFKVNWVIEIHKPHVDKPLVVNGESFHM
jgi:hypothetical protein